MTYSTEWVGALQDVKDAGSAVTFTRITQNPSATTGVLGSPTTSTISGYAIRVRGSPETYKNQGLVDLQSPTLFFVPSVFGSLPLPGDTVSWNSTTYTAQDVNPIAPDGTAIATRVVLTL